MDIPFYISLLSLFTVLGVSLELALGIRRLGLLRDVPPLRNDPLPRVSIIIPACNEAATIQAALQSILALDYANLAIIVVNDRSTDKTKEVLEKIKDPRLRIIEISELPAHWLGKTHAMQTGADQADGEYLLFTDADVHMEKTTLQRAIHHAEKYRLDHLSAVFDVQVKNSLLLTMMLEFCGGLFWLFKPWKARDPQSRYFMGIGAFNLVRTTAYHAVGGHRPIALCPVDDIMLGKLIKGRGFRQDCLSGHQLIAVEWYSSIPEMINGVTKNTYAGLDYSPAKLIGVTIFQVLAGVWPLLALLFANNPARLLAGLTILVRLVSFGDAARRASINPLHALWTLLSAYISIYMSWRAVLLTIRHKGIHWRGTFYPLDELKKNRI